MTHDSHVCTDNCTSGRLEELLFAPHTASRMEPPDALVESEEMVTIPAELWRDAVRALAEVLAQKYPASCTPYGSGGAPSAFTANLAEFVLGYCAALTPPVAGRNS